MNKSNYLDFIEEIKKRPILYDRNHIHFHNFLKKEHLWNWLSRKYNVDAKKKYRTLRYKFICFKRERENEIKTGTNDVTVKWDLFEPLSFLNKYCRGRKIRPENSLKNSSFFSANNKFEFAIVSNDSDQNLSIEGSEFDSITDPVNERKSTQDLECFRNENSSTDEDSENMIFMKMIGKKLELFSNKDRNRIQIKILELFNEELDKFDS